jgi:pilus assembly protein Flp/PilA
MRDRLGSFLAEDSGQGLVEYALVIFLVSIGLILALTVLKNQVSNLFTNINTAVNGAAT